MKQTWRSDRGLLSTVATFVVLTLLTWQRSGDLIVDWGREVYTAWSVSQLHTIPLDVLFLFGPLSSLVNGGVMSLFGDSIAALLVVNLAVLLVTLGVIRHVARTVFGRRAANRAGFLFLFLSGFPHLVGYGNYNFLTPYSHGATHGLVLGLLLVACLLHALEHPGNWPWLIAGIFTGLAFCSKPEFGIAAIVTLFTGLFISRSLGGRLWREAALTLGGAGLSVVLVASVLTAYTTESPDVILTPSINAIRSVSIGFPFYKASAGLDYPIWNVFWGVGILCGTLGLTRLPGLRLSREANVPVGDKHTAWVLRISVPAFVSLTLVAPRAWLIIGRSLTWGIILAIIVFLPVALDWRTGASENRQRRAAKISVMAVFSLALLTRMGLAARFDHYGFSLAAPATLLCIGLLSQDLPVFARRKNYPGARRSRLIAPTLTLFLVLSSVWQSASFYAQRTYAVSAGADRILAFTAETDPRTSVFDSTLQFLVRDRTLRNGGVVIPEGALFNYFMRSEITAPIVSWMPLELLFAGADNSLEAIQASRPEAIIIIDRDMHEWTAPKSTDYVNPYVRIERWVNENYCETSRFGARNAPPPNGFGITVLKPCRPGLRY